MSGYLTIILFYFLVLFVISYFTSKNASSQSFFNGDKKSPWYLVAYGMIGVTLSGITFISVPGKVHSDGFAYYQLVLGNAVGYVIIARILLPLYYKLNLTSIYGYLENRFGFWAYKTGASFFLLSRVMGASFRLFVIAIVLQLFIFNNLNFPFWATVCVTILLIYLYTFRGGIKTIVWTDTLQTTFLIAAVVITISYIFSELSFSFSDFNHLIFKSADTQIFVWEWEPRNNFFKQFFSGIFLAIAMMGLDQDMMQKNLTCRSLQEAQRNMYWTSSFLVIINFIFLILGALLYQFAFTKGIALPEDPDHLYPLLANEYFPSLVGKFFFIGVVAAAYSSADSALTALTTSFCVDFLGFEKEPGKTNTTIRWVVHIGFSLVIVLLILFFNALGNKSIVDSLFMASGFTYGPLLGLFAFGIFSQRRIRDNQSILLVCLLAPVLSYFFKVNAGLFIPGYKVGFEILIINSILTYLGLWILSLKNSLQS